MTVDTNADTAAAATKRTAIAAEARETGADDVFLPTGETMTTYSMTISRDRDGTTVKIADSANAMDDDPKFIDQDAGLDGGRTMHVRTMEPNDDGEVVEEVVIVATDIDGPATPFGGGRANSSAERRNHWPGRLSLSRSVMMPTLLLTPSAAKMIKRLTLFPSGKWHDH